MRSTTPIAFRLPNQLYWDIRQIAEDRGLKVGSYLRKVIPFIRKHSYLMNMDSFMLEEFGSLVKNRNILISLEGEKVSVEELVEKGFNFHKYTGMVAPNVFGKMGGIEVLDYRLVQIRKGYHEVKKIS